MERGISGGERERGEIKLPYEPGKRPVPKLRKREIFCLLPNKHKNSCNAIALK
jgi:hypothetical protein